ncbi:ligand-binding protein SH3 [archaeon]|nr:ligand-binding protein SH3 [archaeon]|tara:strand:+ start:3822 stop:4301 length:480 start_codon:yes stop_codon:yes gene_type:complete
MDFQIIIGLLLTILPIFELRGGLPVIVEYAVRNNVSIWPWFILVLILNIFIIFFIFWFLDTLHERLMNTRFYRKIMDRYLSKIRKKADKLEKKMDNLGFLALALFVAVPLPGTGAWTGTLVAWVLGLERWKSFLAIALGVSIAGLIILFASLGIFMGFF